MSSFHRPGSQSFPHNVPRFIIERLLGLLLLNLLVSGIPVIQDLSKDERVGDGGETEGDHDERITGFGERSEDSCHATQKQQR